MWKARIFRVAVPVLGFLMLSSSSLGEPVQSPRMEKHRRTVAIMRRVGELDRLALRADQGSPHRDVGSKVKAAAKRIVLADRNLEVLEATAGVLKAIFEPRKIEPRSYDQVMEAGYWDCVDAMAAIPGKDAELALARLAVGLHGGDKLEMDECRESQRLLKN